MSVSTQPGATQLTGMSGSTLDGERLGERDERSLGGGIVSVEGLAALSRRAGHDDDPATRAHERERRPGGEEDGVQVGRHVAASGREPCP